MSIILSRFGKAKITKNKFYITKKPVKIDVYDDKIVASKLVKAKK